MARLSTIRDAFIVRTGPTYIMVPPGMKVENLVVGEALRNHRDVAGWTLDG